VIAEHHEALVLPVDDAQWHARTRLDAAANALADRHYSRRRPGSGQIGPPGRKLVLVTPCERAVWLSHWPYPELALDGLDAWRCPIFRNEGAGLSSDLIRAAMALTLRAWAPQTPPDGWVTWVDTRKVGSANPGYCFKRAGWWRDKTYHHRHLVRLRAKVVSDEATPPERRMT
jgi:hypothetical protein